MFQSTTTILYADNDQPSRNTMSRFLEGAGYQVWQAGSGNDALRLAAGGPDLILLDVQMPDIDGIEVCRRLKATPSTAAIPVLLLSTGHREDALRMWELDDGADGYLTRPQDGNLVLATIRALLRARRAEQALRQAYDELDRRVRERTVELKQTIDRLQVEILVREQAEERFKAQYTAFPLPTYTWQHVDGDFVLLDCNDAARNLTDGAVTSLLGRRASELYQDRPDILADLHRCLATRAAIRRQMAYRYRALPRDAYLDVTYVFIPPGMVMIHSEDITIGRQAELALRESELHLTQSREQLRALAARRLSIQEEERTHISREVHDELGQALTALKLDLAWLLRHTEPDEQVSLRGEQMAGRIDATIQAVRRIATELRPAVLDDLGLVAAVEWQAQEFQERTGVACELAIRPEDLVVGGDLATTLFRVLQEALTNIARHAAADSASVTLSRGDGLLVLEVGDNGCGISPKDVAAPHSLGLIGMRERVRALGGRIAFAGEPGKGTLVTVEFPFPSEETW